MAQAVRRDRLGNVAEPVRFLADQLHRILGNVPSLYVAREEPIAGSCHAPPLAQVNEEFRRERDVAIFLSLTLIDANDHSFAINVRGLQRDSLGNAQPCGVADGQNRSMLHTAYAVEELEDFLWAQNDRKLLRRLRCGDDLIKGPLPFERDLVQESQGGHSDEN